MTVQVPANGILSKVAVEGHTIVAVGFYTVENWTISPGKGLSQVSSRTSATVVWLCAGLSYAMAQEPTVRLPKSCAILSAQLKDEIKRLRALQEQARRQRAAPAPDVVSAFGRVFGNKDAGVQALKDMKSHRAVADDLNAALRSNNCATIDIEAELSQLH